MSLLALAGALLVSAAPAAPPQPALERATGKIPDLVEDLRYATEDNFLHHAVYPKGAACWLHPDTLARLTKAADALRKQGYRLRVFDCYRPLSVQWEMWKLYPHPGYVADPHHGSNHNRGTAVDLTLADKDGNPVEMPTPFDTFSPAAHHGFAGASKEATKNRETLRAAMEAAGFKKNRMEWWHYDLPGATKYPIRDQPLVPEAPGR